MAIVTTDNKYYSEIATAIREKTNSSASYKPAQMAAAIRSIQGGEAMSIETIRTICYVPSDFEKNYTAVEYILGSGTQYIDTGVKGKSTLRVKMKAQMIANSIGTPFLFGARDSGTVASFCMFFHTNSGAAWKCDYQTSSNRYTFDNTVATKTGVLEIDANQNAWTVNGLSKTFTAATFTSNSNLVLLAINTGGTIADYAPAKIFNCQIYDNGTLVRDFVPCFKNYDGAVGLYDMVNEKFYGNAGSGSFIAPVNPVNLPDGYTQISYIQSSGTQYIDTGFKPNNNTRVWMDFEFPTQPSVNATLFGVRTNASSKVYDFMYLPSGIFRSDYNNQTGDQTWTVSATGRRTVDKNKETTTFNGSSQSYTNSSFTADHNLLLLAINNNGSATWNASVMVYACQIYDNGTLIRDFVPCINPSGVYGLYDTANKQFYSNAGSGSFTGA